jgi:cell division inhibitor SepF
MGARDYWDRMLVYFGITDEPGDDVDPGEAPRGRSAHGGTAARREAFLDEWEDDEPAPRRRAGGRQAGAAGVSVTQPRSFNDAPAVADPFKRGTPVIVNFQQTDADVRKRLVDFISGLTYGLDGSVSQIADKVLLLVPPDVEVSAEERAALVEGGFFNQS